jgi:serine/threonine protein kinase
LLQDNGDYKTLKIVDFGLAKVLDNEQTSGVCGSLGFIAPEIYQYECYGREIDMFSFGVILFLMMSGEKPFTDKNDKVLEQKTLRLAYHVDQGIWTTVSQDAKNLVRKLLTFREDRLDAAQALDHEWFQMADDSHSLPAPRYGRSRRLLDVVSTHCSVFANFLEPYLYKALNVTSFVIPQSNTSSKLQEKVVAYPNTGECRRLSIDPSVHEALFELVSPTGRLLYNGTVVPDTESDTGGGAMLVEERIPQGGVVLPYYIASRESYTEYHGRIICRKIAEAIQALHDAGVAHRNIQLGNIIVEESVS